MFNPRFHKDYGFAKAGSRKFSDSDFGGIKAYGNIIV